jgi:hypothetical protein
MDWGERIRIQLQVFAVALAAICPAVLISMAPTAKRQFDSSNWPKVSGTILGVIPKTSMTDKGKVEYFGRAMYRYNVNGQDFTSDLTDLGPGAKQSDIQTALADVSQYHVGDTVDVYYDPNEPSIGILSTGIPPIHFYLLIGLAIGSVIGIIGLFFTIPPLIRFLRSSLRTKNQGTAQLQFVELQGPEWIIEDLGEQQSLFRPKRTNIGAGLVLSVACGIAGVCLAKYILQRPDPKPLRDRGDVIAKYALISLFGGVCPVGGLVLFVWMIRLAGHRVTVSEKGFSYLYRGSAQVVPWVHVAKIQEVFTEQEIKIIKVPGTGFTRIDRSFVVQRKDGKEFRFTANSINDIPKFASLLHDASEKQSIPWEQIQQ